MKRLVLYSVVVVMIVGCGQSPSQYSFSKDNRGSAEIWDGATNTVTGNCHFFFLPPVLKNPTVAGVFDGSQAPTVEVRELAGVPGAFTPGPNVVFSASGNAIAISLAEERYQANWKTSLSSLDATKFYRISILVAGKALGFADVDVCNSGKELKNVDTDEYIALLDDRTLPIKFRIEQGALGFISSVGGKVIAANGAVSLEVPADAVATSTIITAASVTPSATNLIAEYALSPSTLMFSSNATVTLSYNEAVIPAGKTEADLKVMVLQNGAWTKLATTIDAVANTATAQISALGQVAVGMPQSTGSQIPDGLFAWYTGDNTAYDAYGTHHATWRNTPTYAPGKVNQAFVISPTSDEYTDANCIMLPNDPVFEFSSAGQYSYSFWMKVNQTPGGWFQPVIMKYDDDGHWVWGIWTEGGRLLVGRHENNKATGQCISADVWEQVTATYNNGVHKVYVNGVEQSLDGAEAVDITQSSNAVSLGTIFMSNGTLYGIYEGALDEIMFFNRELSAAETMSIYHLADQ